MAAKKSKSKKSSKSSNAQRKGYRGSFKTGLLEWSRGKSLVALAFVVVFGGVGSYLYQISSAATSPEIRSALGNFCMTDQGDSYSAENPINVATCDGRNAENWKYTGGKLEFDSSSTAAKGQRCAQPKNGGTAAQTPVVMDECSNSAAQKWTSTGGGFKNTSSGRYLTVPAADTSRSLQIRDNAPGNKDQNWSQSSYSTPAPKKNLSCAGSPGSPNRGSAGHYSGECNDAQIILSGYGNNEQTELTCMSNIFDRESHWDPTIENASGAYGIPQALPGSKMSSAGPNWQTNAYTQIKWALGYMKGRYGSPCGAWAYWQVHSDYGPEQPASGPAVKY